MGVMFFIGIAVGWGIAYWILTKAWKRRVARLKQAIHQQQQELHHEQQRVLEWKKQFQRLQTTLQSSEAEHQDINHQLQQSQQDIEQIAHTVDTLQHQLQLQEITTQELAQEKTELLQKMKTKQSVYELTLEEWQHKVEKSEQDAEAFLEDLVQKEHEIQTLSSDNQSLMLQIDAINKKLRWLEYAKNTQNPSKRTDALEGNEQSSSLNQITAQIMRQINDENLMESLSETLFHALPTLHFLRDSIQEIAQIYKAQKSHFPLLIEALILIGDGNYKLLKQYQKIHATNDQWSECRVSHINLLRLYFQKCTQTGGVQIWVSKKQDTKTQRRDFEWLSHQMTC